MTELHCGLHAAYCVAGTVTRRKVLLVVLALGLASFAAEPAFAQRVATSLRPASAVTDSARGLRVRPIVNGVIIGASLGAVFGALIAQMGEVTVPRDSPLDEILYGALTGGVIGGVFGLIVALPPRNEAMRTRGASLHIAALPSALVGRISFSP